VVYITLSGNPFVDFTLFSSPALKPQKCTPMSLPTTAVVHNWRRLNNKSGLYPIYLRITIDRIQKYEMIPVPAKESKEQWIGEDDNWVRDDHPYFFEINIKIGEQKQAIQNLIKRYYLAGKMMTFSTITSELKRPDTIRVSMPFLTSMSDAQQTIWNRLLSKNIRPAWSI
jgi:hypothetical protein